MRVSQRRAFALWSANVFFLTFLGACGRATVTGVGTQSGASKATCPVTLGSQKISVNWAANREHAVNSTGGGYRVYYCSTENFEVDGARFVDVPATNGNAPTTATISGVGSGTLYVKVVAYSSLSVSGSSGSKSDASSEVKVAVP